jgi:predicted ester cyclase
MGKFRFYPDIYMRLSLTGREIKFSESFIYPIIKGEWKRNKG